MRGYWVVTFLCGLTCASTAEAVRLEFQADFTTATIAFFDRARRHDPRLVLDDRPCNAVGPAWTPAEDALIAALIRDRERAEDLRTWASLRDIRRIEVVHETLSNIHEARLAISDRRARHDPRVYVGVRIAMDAGYLVLAGPEGVQEYCIAVERVGTTVRLLPRLVNMSMR